MLHCTCTRSYWIFFSITTKTRKHEHRHTCTHPLVRLLSTHLEIGRSGINLRPQKISIEAHSLVQKDGRQNLNPAPPIKRWFLLSWIFLLVRCWSFVVSASGFKQELEPYVWSVWIFHIWSVINSDCSLLAFWLTYTTMQHIMKLLRSYVILCNIGGKLLVFTTVVHTALGVPRARKKRPSVS